MTTARRLVAGLALASTAALALAGSRGVGAAPTPPGSEPPIPSVADGADALARAAAFLWSRQGADGGWHAPTGLLRSGQAMTPFVLLSLLDVPVEVCPQPTGGVERALAFLRSRMDEDGWLGRADPPFVEMPRPTRPPSASAVWLGSAGPRTGRGSPGCARP